MPDYIPSGDGEFDDFATNFVTYVGGHLGDFGLVLGDMAAVNAAIILWNTAYPAVEPAFNIYSATVQTKETARGGLEGAIRALVGVVQAKGAVVTPASKTAARIPVADTTKTPVPPPTSRPIVRVEVSGPRTHKLSWVDENTPNSIAKPKGVYGLEIHLFVGTAPPTSASQMHQITTDTKTPYLYEFDAADAGKTAYYWCRWVNTKGEVGPWCVMVSATITG